MEGEKLIGEKIIITCPVKLIRKMARDALRGKWKTATLGTLAAFCAIIVAAVVGFAAMIIVGTKSPVLTTIVGSVAIYFILGGFYAGYCKFILKLARRQDPGIKDIFCTGRSFFKAGIVVWLIYIAIMFITTPIIFFINLYAPISYSGIIVDIFNWATVLIRVVISWMMSISFGLSLFLICDNPQYGVWHSMTTSMDFMSKNKWKMLCLGMSFIGWLLLIYAAIGILTFAIFSLNPNSVIGAFVPILGFFGMLCLMPYIMTAIAIFYDMVIGKLRVKKDISEQLEASEQTDTGV